MVVSVLGPEGNVLCRVNQRELYRKNDWPAKADIVKALQAMPLADEDGKHTQSRPDLDTTRFPGNL